MPASAWIVTEQGRRVARAMHDADDDQRHFGGLIVDRIATMKMHPQARAEMFPARAELRVRYQWLEPAARTRLPALASPGRMKAQISARSAFA